MSFNIQYGCQDKTKIYEIAKAIAEDGKKGSFFEATPDKINNTFFGGGIVSAKPFSDLIAPISLPKCLDKLEESKCTVIKKTLYKTSLLCYLELIPGIGTLVAIITPFARSYLIESKMNALKKAVRDLNKLPEGTPEIEKFQKAAKVFNKAVKYTHEINLYWGALIAILPLYKLAIGVTRGCAFHIKKSKWFPLCRSTTSRT